MPWYAQLAKRTGRPIVWQSVHHRWAEPNLWREQLDAVAKTFADGYRTYGITEAGLVNGRFTLKNVQTFDEFPTWKNVMFLPVEIKKLLPMMMLVDVTADPRRFVYRLVGTQEVMERVSDPTGKSVAEAFFGGSLEETLGCYDYVVRNRAPFCYRDPYAASDGQIQDDDIIYLPLSDDGDRVNIVLVYTHSRSLQRRGRAGSLL